MENSTNAESRAGGLGREQDREDQRSGDSDCQKQSESAGHRRGNQSRRTARADRTRANPGDVATRGSKAITGGIVSQLIGSLVNQRALFESQIEAINEQIQGLQQLQDELNRQFEDNP